MPIFTDQSLSASSNFAAPATLYLGSSAFELADTLHLLPHQANSQLLPFENVQLQHLVVDFNSYYSKISKRGLIRLICDHFHSATGSGDDLSLRTDIGTFSFARMEGCTTVRFNARERARDRISPHDQDFDALQQCALGKFCRKEHVNDDYFSKNTPTLPIGLPQWVQIKIHDVVAFSDLDYSNCVRFMIQRDYDELGFELDFARQTLDEMLHSLEQYWERFDQYTQEGLGTLKILCKTDLRQPQNMRVVLAVIRWVLAGVARAPSRAASSSESPQSLATSRPSQLASNTHQDTPSGLVSIAMTLDSGRETGPEGIH